jgi:SAM-dependent methyltransferase
MQARSQTPGRSPAAEGERVGRAVAEIGTSSMLEHVQCGLCGADDYDVLYGPRYELETDRSLATKFRASGDELLIYQLVRCRGCALQYVNPRPPADLIYSGYAQGDDPTYVSQIRARERTFAASLDAIERAAGARGRLLDVGTAAGAFVAAARRRGWNAEGCEPNQWLADWGARRYGIPIRNGDLLQLDYPQGSFDVITLWDVIEHTTHPRLVLERCRTLMRPGGVLVVNYPDIGSWIARALGRRWPFLSSVHLSYFDRRTMRDILAKSGYRVDGVRPHVQRLELDYILFRGSVFSRTLASAARATARGLGVSRLKVPYWLGQTCVFARKMALMVSAWSALPSLC